MRIRLDKPVQLALFAELPLLAIGWWLFQEHQASSVAIDFSNAFRTAAHSVAHGHSPYPALHSRTVDAGAAYVYPPLAAFAATPFLLVPAAVAGWIATALMLACLFGALYLFGVRDWRCYGLALVWKPTLFAVQTANLSLPLLLLVALAWRKRSGVAVGSAVAAKLFLWPLVVWQAAARPRAAARAVATFVLLIVVPWAVLRFADAGLYLRLTRRVERLEGPHGYTLAACGLPAWAVAAVAVVLAVAIFAVARRDERASFALAIVASLLLSPVVWLHYFVLLAAVIAVYRRSLSAAWFTPFLLWLVPSVTGNHVASHGAASQLALAVVTPSLVWLSAARPERVITTGIVSPELAGK